jgi:hypothetical protein
MRKGIERRALYDIQDDDASDGILCVEKGRAGSGANGAAHAVSYELNEVSIDNVCENQVEEWLTKKVGHVLGSGNTVFRRPTKSVVSTSIERSASSCVLVVFPGSVTSETITREEAHYIISYHASEHQRQAPLALPGSRPSPLSRTPRNSAQRSPPHDDKPELSQHHCQQLQEVCNKLAH